MFIISTFFISAKKNQKEKFINAISNPNNSMIIKSKITDAMQAKK
ncbi:PF08862 domain protein [Staphylococcus aureus subsp. aureus CO-41]|nr:PF08862 domain protein [Staphylococcus aureus subsp. aureus CO-41]